MASVFPATPLVLRSDPSSRSLALSGSRVQTDFPPCPSFTQGLCNLLEIFLLQGRYFTEDPPCRQDVLEFFLRQGTQLCGACKGDLPLPVEGNGAFDTQLWP